MPGGTVESTPLLSSNAKGAGQQHARTNSSSNASYYFLSRQGSTNVGGDAEFGGRHVEEEIMPAGANEEEFTPRPLGPRVRFLSCMNFILFLLFDVYAAARFGSHRLRVLIAPTTSSCRLSRVRPHHEHL